MNIPRITTLLGSLVIAASLLYAANAQANLIVNGTFDTEVPSNGTGGDWTSSNIDGAGGWRSAGGNPGAMFILNDGGDSATDPAIWQTVTGLTAGAAYRLSGDYANVYNCCGARGTNTFAVDVGGVQTLFGFPGVGVWGTFTVDFTVPDTQVLIRFRSEINGDDTEYKIDHIALVALRPDEPGAGVPLPSSLFLLGLGLAGLQLLRRRAS